MNTSRQSFIDESIFYKPTQKQVTNLLVGIEGKPHEIKNYRQLLLQKQEFEKSNQIVIGGFQKLNQILDPKVNRVSLQEGLNDQYQVGGICPNCMQEIRGRGINCNICKNFVCRNCLARNRQMKNGLLLKFCQKCDRIFLQALIDKDFLKQFVLYQKAFETLVRQQQSLQVLLSSEKVKIKSEQIGQERKKVIKNDETIQQLKYEKQTNKEKIQQIQNKIDWGESMTKSLRVKYRKIKKLLKQSFGSSNSDSAYVQWEPPKAEDDIDLDDDNINQSFITTNFDKTPEMQEIEGVHDKEFCKCSLI